MVSNAEQLHQNSVIVDGHCDTILELYKHKRSFWDYNKKGHLDWPRLKDGKVNIQFMAFYIEPEYKPCGALSRVLELLDYFHTVLNQGEQRPPLILNRGDLQLVTAGSNTALLLAIEGGEVLEGKLGILRILHKLGFRCLTLTWNQRNQLADGVWEKDTKGGLTTLGKEVVREMNGLGMLVDVSHLSDAGFWDVVEISEKPVAATHSCCRAIFPHPRNLTDEQLLAIRDNGGIIGVNFYPGFLGNAPVSVDKVIQHIEHAVAVAGLEHVGLGSDFDGINKTPKGLEDITKLPALTNGLLRLNWKESDVQKILGGNFIRVLYHSLPE